MRCAECIGPEAAHWMVPELQYFGGSGSNPTFELVIFYSHPVRTKIKGLADSSGVLLYFE